MSPEQLRDQAGPYAKIIHVIVISFIVFILWASFASLDEVVRGPGKVVPSSQTQVIQSLEGGILSELPVWEGKEVEAGEVLVKLSDYQFKGAFQETESKVVSLRAKLIRLTAEISKQKKIDFGNNLCDGHEEICQSEQQLFLAAISEYNATVEDLSAQVVLQNGEVQLLQSNVNKGVAPKIDLIKAKQSLNQAKSALSSFKSEYLSSRSEAHALTLAELQQYEANLSIRKDQLARTVLKAPVRGIVNKVSVTTIGGIAAPGDPILELTPLNDELHIEAKIQPKDVAFVYPKMKATVKLTAYDFSVYGSLDGHVMHVSADTFDDDLKHDEEPYYKVLIKIDKDSQTNWDNGIEIRPGMQAIADLQTGQKTVLQYLLKPLFKTTEAFRER